MLSLLVLLPFTATQASVIDVPARPGELNRAVEAMLTAESEAPASSTTTLRLAAGRHQVTMCARVDRRAGGRARVALLLPLSIPHFLI